ncbi:DNA-3-methyladenine glycosylase [Parenemella sanctibonifatiensis]|uniref:Putative 3-methyladenine DNA glycosylase n=1 Tax=Parenemella sanctibonifatiensis TaxID=2016505 RepID=A0A255E479_9ACTN|nr:DNA-3-methyladenine glycosylase [Parenemella sanctibonifatiensis]OYN86368.1 3-methyladenine DNA glycosylase [Parenemella sanctibonifatiensis]
MPTPLTSGLTPLPREFFDRPSVELAPRLLGCLIVTDPVVLRITEVEAYAGRQDPGSHAYRGQTARNATMFGPAGHLYVYRHMGLHSCMNLVAEDPGEGTGCLIRAGEVVAGIETARQRRTAAGVTRKDTDLAQGPGRLTVAMGISWHDDGMDVCAPDARLWVSDRSVEPPIGTGPRIGLNEAASDPVRHPWRFRILDDPTVSGPPAYNR